MSFLYILLVYTIYKHSYGVVSSKDKVVWAKLVTVLSKTSCEAANCVGIAKFVFNNWPFGSEVAKNIAPLPSSDVLVPCIVISLNTLKLIPLATAFTPNTVFANLSIVLNLGPAYAYPLLISTPSIVLLTLLV